MHAFSSLVESSLKQGSVVYMTRLGKHLRTLSTTSLHETAHARQRFFLMFKRRHNGMLVLMTVCPRPETIQP